MVSVAFKGDLATVTVLVTGAGVLEVLQLAQNEIRMAREAGVKTDAEIQADAQAGAAARIAARASVTTVPAAEESGTIPSQETV